MSARAGSVRRPGGVAYSSLFVKHTPAVKMQREFVPRTGHMSSAARSDSVFLKVKLTRIKGNSVSYTHLTLPTICSV